MGTFAAFLRGINVGGRRVIPMAELREAFTTAGAQHPRTYIQSGNVAFESRARSVAKLRAQLEESLAAELDVQGITVILRTAKDLQHLIARDPLGELPGDAKAYVTFLADKPTAAQLKALGKLPCFSPSRDVEIFGHAGAELFALSHKVKDRWGFPNAFVEKQLGVPATTRNWKTIGKVAELCEG